MFISHGAAADSYLIAAIGLAVAVCWLLLATGISRLAERLADRERDE